MASRHKDQHIPSLALFIKVGEGLGEKSKSKETKENIAQVRKLSKMVALHNSPGVIHSTVAQIL